MGGKERRKEAMTVQSPIYGGERAKPHIGSRDFSVCICGQSSHTNFNENFVLLAHSRSSLSPTICSILVPRSPPQCAPFPFLALPRNVLHSRSSLSPAKCFIPLLIQCSGTYLKKKTDMLGQAIF